MLLILFVIYAYINICLFGHGYILPPMEKIKMLPKMVDAVY